MCVCVCMLSCSTFIHIYVYIYIYILQPHLIHETNCQHYRYVVSLQTTPIPLYISKHILCQSYVCLCAIRSFTFPYGYDIKYGYDMNNEHLKGSLLNVNLGTFYHWALFMYV